MYYITREIQENVLYTLKYSSTVHKTTMFAIETFPVITVYLELYRTSYEYYQTICYFTKYQLLYVTTMNDELLLPYLSFCHLDGT